MLSEVVMKIIKPTRTSSSMPVKTERVMPLFKLYFRFVRDAIQLPTPHRLSSEPALRVLMSRIWIQVHARTTSALVRYLPHVFFPPKNKT